MTCANGGLCLPSPSPTPPRRRAARRCAHTPVKSGHGEGKEGIAPTWTRARNGDRCCLPRWRCPSGVTTPRAPRPPPGRGAGAAGRSSQDGAASLLLPLRGCSQPPFALQTCRENFPPSHFPVRAVKLNPALICQKHFSADIFNKYFQLLNTFVGAIFPPFSPFSSYRMGSESLNSKYVTLIKGFPPFLLHPEAEVVFSILKLN